MTRLTINAADLCVGDNIPGVGKVRGLAKDTITVAITLDWATLPEIVLSSGDVVYVDRTEGTCA